jgi:uncharacterized protein
MRYWDSSALVTLALKQTASAEAWRLSTEDPLVVTWWGSIVECHSAVARLERVGALGPAEADDARRRLIGLAAGWQEVEPHPRVRDLALRCLRRHDLRAGDALQLAAALEASSHMGRLVDFVSFDARLSAAALREGCAIPANIAR